jgi:hypothetical protein
MIKRLAILSLLLVMLFLVLGWISLDSEFYAVEAAAAHSDVLPMKGLQQSLAQPVMLEAEWLPEGQQVVLVPQYSDILIKGSGNVKEVDGLVRYDGGRLYHIRDGRQVRAWLYMVVSEDEPKITVEP